MKKHNPIIISLDGLNKATALKIGKELKKYIYGVKFNDLLDKFDDYTLKHIPREENKEADKLANEAIDIVNMACLWPK